MDIMDRLDQPDTRIGRSIRRTTPPSGIYSLSGVLHFLGRALKSRHFYQARLVPRTGDNNNSTVVVRGPYQRWERYPRRECPRQSRANEKRPQPKGGIGWGFLEGTRWGRPRAHELGTLPAALFGRHRRCKGHGAVADGSAIPRI